MRVLEPCTGLNVWLGIVALTAMYWRRCGGLSYCLLGAWCLALLGGGIGDNVVIGGLDSV